MQKIRDMVRDATHDLDDVLISLQAGQQTANRLKSPWQFKRLIHHTSLRPPWKSLKSSDPSDTLFVLHLAATLVRGGNS